MSEEIDLDNLPVSGKSCCCGSCKEPPRGKLYCHNWLSEISGTSDCELVEVQFKNTRKGYFKNSLNLDLQIGDIVAVEANPGHDIGEVTLIGKLVELQMRKANLHPDYELRRIFRKARQNDLDKYAEAKAREHDTMIRSRKIAEELQLSMKIGDVEYQGDGGKAIFYYIADERVDFRKLIRVLADTFKVRIEMKQIGARQEAGRIGGIGPCGRPLCCASWMTNFVSVGTSAARFQDISMNPQKLAGQCAKLKCCLNFEVDVYMEAQKRMPPKDVTLETVDSTYYLFKSDVLKRELTYSTDKQMPVNCVTIDASRVFEIISLNKRGIKVEKLERDGSKEERREFIELVGQDSLTRFDKTKKKKKRGKGNRQESTEQPPQSPVTAQNSAPAQERQGQRRGKGNAPHRKNQENNRRRNDNSKKEGA